MARQAGKSDSKPKDPAAKGPERMWRDREMVSGLVSPELRGKVWGELERVYQVSCLLSWILKCHTFRKYPVGDKRTCQVLKVASTSLGAEK